ncbi:MAG: hypothetical protein BGO37_07210 [Cellulomonas sp. 73-92]|uniref:hypothetical protein n=1 Tax=Cellulomonas sp. 73-92 TaxID=1895740 RepID=UPI000928B712|nr:hypothetical protein [Cellulomonas sp. 73-92]OJV78506.1 MAG: hypothetical protein BGO37_07210 [Cellulomonas sp. 73-92]
MVSNRPARHVRRPDVRRRRPVVRLVLAGGVLVGLGAGLTSGAWTDSAFFQSAASSASVDLQACVTATPTNPSPTWTCTPADTSGNAAAILPSTTFSGMTPGHVYTTKIRVLNNGTAALTVTVGYTALAEPLTGTAPNATVALDTTSFALAAGAAQVVNLTITTPTTWDQSHANQSSAAALQVLATGTAS